MRDVPHGALFHVPRVTYHTTLSIGNQGEKAMFLGGEGMDRGLGGRQVCGRGGFG